MIQISHTLFFFKVLLCSLNKQVRHFTGTGNTPMVYHLRPVVENIQKNAEEDGDRRVMKLCQTILKAMQSRPDDNYVAYRKVCCHCLICLSKTPCAQMMSSMFLKYADPYTFFHFLSGAWSCLQQRRWLWYR